MRFLCSEWFQNTFAGRNAAEGVYSAPPDPIVGGDGRAPSNNPLRTLLKSVFWLYGCDFIQDSLFTYRVEGKKVGIHLPSDISILYAFNSLFPPIQLQVWGALKAPTAGSALRTHRPTVLTFHKIKFCTDFSLQD